MNQAQHEWWICETLHHTHRKRKCAHGGEVRYVPERTFSRAQQRFYYEGAVSAAEFSLRIRAPGRSQCRRGRRNPLSAHHGLTWCLAPDTALRCMHPPPTSPRSAILPARTRRVLCLDDTSRQPTRAADGEGGACVCSRTGGCAMARALSSETPIAAVKSDAHPHPRRSALRTRGLAPIQPSRVENANASTHQYPSRVHRLAAPRRTKYAA